MKAFVVVLNIHFECGDAVGVAVSLEHAQEVAQRHSSERLSGAPPLEWRAHKGGWTGSPPGDWGFDYAVTEMPLVSREDPPWIEPAGEYPDALGEVLAHFARPREDHWPHRLERRRIEGALRCSCLDNMEDPDRKRKCQKHGVAPWLVMAWPEGA